MRSKGLFRVALKPAVLAGLLGSVLASSFAGVALAAPPPITFELFIGDSCVYGMAKPDSFLKVIITDKSGSQKGRGAVETGPDGYWEACMQQGVRPLSPGDTIKVTDFETGQKRNIKVPTLTAKVDRGANVISGKAPAGTTVEVEAFDFRFDLWGEQYDVVQHTVAVGGAYSYDFDNDGVDIKGGASLVVRWHNGGDTVTVGRFQIAPYIVLQLGLSDFAGAAGPNTPIAMTLTRDGAIVARGNGVGSYSNSSFYGDFVDADGETYIVRGGEKLNAPALGAVSGWRIPAIKGTANVAADSVSGKCFANGRFVILAQGISEPGYGFGFGTANADGSFTVSLGDQVDIKKNFRVGILCYSAEGDEVSQEFMTR
ncbi:MAG TPA: hypothetical protein VIF08_08280 [Candidatus Limnocylindrales bacterium]